MVAQLGGPLRDHLEQDVAHLLGRGLPPPYPLLGVQPLVGELKRAGRIACLRRQDDGAVGARDLEALAALVHRGDDAVHVVADAVRVEPEQGAELVAAEPVGGAAAGDGLVETPAEPHQQGVAGRVPEGVVVVLEAVEIEQDQHRRLGRGMTTLALRGGNFGVCRRRAPGAHGSGVQANGSYIRREGIRRLWGSDSGGRFRTYGRHSQATVRGTRWLTEDRCDGTLTRVTAGPWRCATASGAGP